MDSETVYLLWTDAAGYWQVHEHVYFDSDEAEHGAEDLREKYYSNQPDVKIVVKEHTLKGPKDD